MDERIKCLSSIYLLASYLSPPDPRQNMNAAGTHINVQNGLAEADAEALRKLKNDFGQALANEARKLQIPAHKMNGAGASNSLVIRDSHEIHILFEKTSNPFVSEWIFSRPELTLTAQDVASSGVHEFGFSDRNLSIVSFQLAILMASENDRAALIDKIAREFAHGYAKIIDRPRTIAGYEGMQPSLDRFSDDHPDFTKNVFLAMRFEESQQHTEIYKAISGALANFGLKCLRADQKIYPVDHDLWTNICTYMMGCSLGICVFEEINVREFNPNVPMEYGFMRAMNRQVLLLKDKRQPRMPTDIVGKVYRDFDTYSISETINKRVTDWCKSDLGLKPIHSTS